MESNKAEFTLLNIYDFEAVFILMLYYVAHAFYFCFIRRTVVFQTQVLNLVIVSILYLIILEN